MRGILLALVILIAVALPAAAWAQCCPSSGQTDYKCTNACPLAKTASTRRATGNESTLTSESLRDAVAKTVAANLTKI